ncbi:MAG: aminotransferase class V-fold PLP-dependent enzyme [Myxococcota bacterium]|nr:aminotransferase class V-fold PLP-dependent enzyme [Myxococcota bacterium]
MMDEGILLSQYWDFDEELTYLNHGSFGACPREILNRQHALQQELERQPMDFLVRKLEQAHLQVRNCLATFVGCSPRDIVFVNNATEAVNTVLRSLPFQPEDEILVTSHTYQACRNAAEIIADKAGAKVVVAEIPFPCSSQEAVIKAIEQEVTSRTRFALIDHVTSPTALVLPIEHIVSKLEREGIWTMVDGAHAVGMLPLDLDRLGASFYTSNCHKWLCAPKSSAFLHVKPAFQEVIRPLSLSHAASLPASDTSRFQKEFAWPGTHDPTPYLMVPDCIDFISSRTCDSSEAWMRRNQNASVDARKTLLSAFAMKEPCPDSMLGSMFAIPLPAGDSTDLQSKLLLEHKIELVVSPWPQEDSRLLRVSMQAYNSYQDIEKLLSALESMKLV